MKTLPVVKKLDVEWVLLLEQAKAMGLDVEEIREFLHRTGHFNKAQ